MIGQTNLNKKISQKEIKSMILPEKKSYQKAKSRIYNINYQIKENKMNNSRKNSVV